MNYDFNKIIEWQDIDSYKGKPIMVRNVGGTFAYILTVVGYNKYGMIEGKYLVETIDFGVHKTKENLEMYKTTDNIHTTYGLYFTEDMSVIRTLTNKEYKTYRETLNKTIVYNKWRTNESKKL